MTDIDLDKLEKLADAALPFHTPRNGFTARSEFEAAVTPATIKSLIASAREAAAEIERLRALLNWPNAAMKAAGAKRLEGHYRAAGHEWNGGHDIVHDVWSAMARAAQMDGATNG